MSDARIGYNRVDRRHVTSNSAETRAHFCAAAPSSVERSVGRLFSDVDSRSVVRDFDARSLFAGNHGNAGESEAPDCDGRIDTGIKP